MQFPYTALRPGIFRPLVPVFVQGPSAGSLLDGLLDTGADRTLLSLRRARQLGVDTDGLSTVVAVRSGTGQILTCKTTSLTLELRRPGARVKWLAQVAIPTQPISTQYWGFKGFLEYFRADFDGPNRVVTLTAGAGLPAAVP